MLRAMSFGLAMIAVMATVGQRTQAAVIIYSGGHDIDETAATLGGVTLAAGNPGDGFSPTAANFTAAIGGLYGAFDALVIGENLDEIDAAGKTAIFDYADAGGHIVILGAHGEEVAFLNSTFGYAVTGRSDPSYDHATISRVAGDGPLTLLALNGSWFMDNAPGTVTYTRDLGGTAMFVDNIGSGTLSWLAWDFCECGELDSDQADWFSVLGTTAIEEPPNAVPEPSTFALAALGGLVLIGARRKRKQAA